MTLTSPPILLSLIVFLPALGALLVGLSPKGRDDLAKQISLAFTVIVLALTVYVAIPAPADPGAIAPSGPETSSRFVVGASQMQRAFSIPWIESFDIYYALGIDGISLPLVLLTSFLSVLAMAASWSISRHVKAYCVLFLLLETGMLGVFLALDFFLFYVFWEVMLLPMYFLIGVWGGPRREYAAIKFFLYTLVGSVLMLIAILMLYFASNLADPALQPHLARCHLNDRVRAEVATALDRIAAGETHVGDVQVHTFNILALQQIGQHTTQFSPELQWWAFLLLLVGFLIKVPAVPLHTWLPDAHVEAPTPISMILAGVLLKMGGYGMIRICYPICPHGGYDLAYFVCLLGVISMVYGAFAALAQKDFKRLVAYSSVSHMGYVVLGLGVWTITAQTGMSGDYWKMGMNGAMFQMIAHGISSAGMFFLVGVVYDRVHHRNLDEFGGLFGKMPVYTGVSMVIFFAALGLPGLCGFIGEVLVVLSVWNYSQTLAVIAAFVMILTAGYILWTIQRVYLGPEYKGPHGDALRPMTRRELAIAAPLLAFAILLGVYPKAVFNYMAPSVDRTVDALAEWAAESQDPITGAIGSAASAPPGSAGLASLHHDAPWKEVEQP